MHNSHLENLMRRYPTLVAMRDDILAAFSLLRDCFKNGGKLLLVGNGGSAADSEHISGELLKGFCHNRPLPKELAAKLPEGYAANLQMGLPAIPLTSFIALSTAFANDLDAGFIYAQLVLALGKPGDVLFVLSTSGNSENILRAVQVAKTLDMKIVSLTGLSGGKLHAVSDCSLRVPQGITYLVQELHLPVYHTLCLMLESCFFGERQ